MTFLSLISLKPLALAAASSLVMITPVFASDPLPTPIENALAKAEAHADLKASFTMNVQNKEDGEFVLRYDAVMDEWTEISGDFENISKDNAKNLEGLKKAESKPGGLTYADFRDDLYNPTILRQDGNITIYQLNLMDNDEAEMPQKMREAITAELWVDEAAEEITGIYFTNSKPFKPVAVAKINTFEMMQSFQKVDGVPVPVLLKFSQKINGSAMMRKIDERTEITFSDIVLVE